MERSAFRCVVASWKYEFAEESKGEAMKTDRAAWRVVGVKSGRVYALRATEANAEKARTKIVNEQCIPPRYLVVEQNQTPTCHRCEERSQKSQKVKS